MATHQRLLVGTQKGLISFHRHVSGWRSDGVAFLGMPVSIVYTDPRTGTAWVCLAHRHWGQKLHRSRDGGRSWQEVAPPAFPPGTEYRPGKLAALRQIWALSHAGFDRPGELYVGTEPGALFYSKDEGESFELVESLWNHPSRLTDWFGTSTDYPEIHSIVVDPRDSDHVYIAVSSAGIFETRDGGKSWNPKNKGLIAAYLPNPEVEVGHDPHRVIACAANPDVLWQQNHCGIFRTTDGGESWEDISGKAGFPYYGFTLAVDHENPERAWVIPAISDAQRVAVDLALCVCVTENGGKSWRALRKGLPQEDSFDLVFRHAMDVDQNAMAFGTNNGNLYISEDYGEQWHCLSHNLARVNAVAFT